VQVEQQGAGRQAQPVRPSRFALPSPDCWIRGNRLHNVLVALDLPGRVPLPVLTLAITRVGLDESGDFRVCLCPRKMAWAQP